RVPTAKYTKVGETLRHVIPSHMQCSMTCGGRACKYENPSRWSDQEQAIKGLYSSWITDNLLAMARPSTEIIEKYNIIEQFQRYGVKTVINLQRPGEHASCGNPLEQASGFTYRPETFMEAGIYFYNFGWKDYGVASLTTILDMVKVMSFAIQEGKMAIHCHAGLGRTGVLLACYLVFTTRMSADQAILFVRAKRPNSVQTRGQLLCVREFAQFLTPLRNVFACAEPKAHAITLSQYLIRQRHLLHGYEARQLKNVPKIVQLVCKLLLDIAENRQVIEEEILEIPDLSAEIEKTVSQSEHELNPLWGRRQSLSYLRKRLSYSDSDLTTVGLIVHQGGPPLTVPTNVLYSSPLSKQCLSQNNLVQSCDPAKTQFAPFQNAQNGSRTPDPLFGSSTSVWDQKKLISTVEQRPGSPLFQRRKHPTEVLRSRTFSLGSMEKSERLERAWNRSETQDRGNTVNGQYASCAERRSSSEVAHAAFADEDRSEEIPCITLQSELTLDSRRLLVAQALAVDIDCEEEEDHKERVLNWQIELNSREGAWERICTERDPFVLSGLMWSWLEQLKEPIITKDDVRTLAKKSSDPHTALYSLDKGPQQTLVCIVDCIARVQTIPEEVEEAFLERCIKAFSKVGVKQGTFKHTLNFRFYDAF
ncbi:PTPC1 protein, partial [Amia calva]|nr:PTPC1 protein [Amia calva]